RIRKRGLRVETLAANKVSFAVQRGENYGLVGESGSGKSTLANLIMGLESLDGGEIRYANQTIANSQGQSSFPYGEIQIVFQDPRSSLNPRMRVRDIVTEPLQRLSPAARQRLGSDEALRKLFHNVGLRPEQFARYPHEFSGGQRQRIAIARALVTQPRLVVLDEPTSALDVSVQAQVINLLKALQAELGLTYIFISHNLGVVRYFCHRVGVLYQGQLVEEGQTADVFSSPKMAYTQQLLAALPSVYGTTDKFREAKRTVDERGI
ncbi:MAG: diguanylate cyclase, partial [Alicyclobacillus sp. RIFOXYA1_FULL_53_8]